MGTNAELIAHWKAEQSAETSRYLQSDQEEMLTGEQIVKQAETVLLRARISVVDAQELAFKALVSFNTELLYFICANVA